MNDRQKILERTIDVLLASVAITLLSPLLVFFVLAIRVTSGCPVFFRQTRPGLHGKPFEILKFRTMTNDADERGNTLPDSARLTRLGRFLRNTSLDELPELVNVLRGEMSIVGPRPLLMEYLCRYTPEQARRHDKKPGITGWAQVNGRNAITWEQKFALDVWYVDNRSMALDLKIICMTIWKVIRREGISAEGEATMSEFKGSYEKENGQEDC